MKFFSALFTFPMWVSALVLFAPPVQSQTAAQPREVRKKLIQVGWDQPSTSYVRHNWRRMESSTPFDGITLVAKFKQDGKEFDENSVQISTKWPRSALENALSDLQSAKFERMKHNFVRVNSSPGSLDWFKDSDWEAACSNIANIAWLARQGGLKGILFDAESYGDKQYKWKAESGHDFQRTFEQARRRGAQMMRAIAREYPDITV